MAVSTSNSTIATVLSIIIIVAFITFIWIRINGGSLSDIWHRFTGFFSNNIEFT